MVNKILIDTNVLLDYLLEREPFFEDAKGIMLSCAEGKAKGCIAAHSIPNMFFILRKNYNAKERREVLSNLCSIFDVKGIDKAKLLAGLSNEDFSDFIGLCYIGSKGNRTKGLFKTIKQYKHQRKKISFF